MERRAERGGKRRHTGVIAQTVESECRGRLRRRQNLETRFCEDAQRAMRAALEPHEVEARDIFHHPAAGLDDLAASIDETQADQEIAGRSGLNASRSGNV